jgi:coenzyme F420-reducing hydrogenase beta subunit
MCPFTHPNEVKREPMKAYAGWSLDEDTRKKSATAGAFTTLAAKFIKDGGVVYGAAYDSKMHLSHIRADKAKDLNKIQSSKYVQSDFSKIYDSIKKDTEKGLNVMVSGTGCQIAGIRAALKCDNLLLVDITCLGVPSPGVFKKYVESLEKKHGKKVVDIDFRDKRTGWRTYSQTVKFEDGTEASCKNHESPYMLGFLGKVYMRPSCHICPFCDTNRPGDITIGDFWGIEKRLPELDDPRGVSLLYGVTRKGKDYLENCDNIELHECAVEDTLQQSLEHPAKASHKREDFFADYKKMDFDKLAKRYMKVRSKIVQFAVNMLKY